MNGIIMNNKHILQSKIKSSGTGWLMFFFLGCPYGFLGKWGLQILFWCTFGGFGIWTFAMLFIYGGMIERYNAKLYAQIAEIERQEKEEADDRYFHTLNTIKNI